MKKTNNVLLHNLSNEDLNKIVKNSPSLQKHLEESKPIFSRIPKEELDKVLHR